MGLLPLVLLALVAFLAYRFVPLTWVPVFAYLSLGLLLNAVGTIALFVDLASSRGPREIVIDSLARAVRKPFRLAHVTRIIAGLAALVGNATVWPTGILRTPRGAIGARKYLLLQSGRSLELHSAVFSFGVVFALYSLSFLGAISNGYGMAFISTMGFGIVFRHLRYATEQPKLPVKLRRESGNPYLIFVLIVGLDFVTLVLSFAVISFGRAPLSLSWIELFETGTDLFGFRDLVRAFFGDQITVVQAAVGIAGLLFWATLLANLIRLQDFPRKDADYHWLAGRENMLGRFTAALQYLDGVNDSSAQTSLHQAIALLGVNQIAPAEQKARLFLEQQGKKVEADNVFQVLLDACVLAPIPENVISAILARAVKDSVADLRLQDALGVLGPAFPGLAPSMEEILTNRRDDYPLTCGVHLTLMSRSEEASDLLGGATPGSELEELVRLSLRLRASLANPEITSEESGQAFRRWVEHDLPIVKNLLVGLDEPREKAIAFGQLWLVRHVATELGQECEQELEYLTDQLKTQVAGDAEAERIVKGIEVRWPMIKKMVSAGSLPA